MSPVRVGVWGTGTWGEKHARVYEALLRQELDAAPEDAAEDQVDRRVELFFFDTEFGIVPKPPGKNSPKGSARSSGSPPRGCSTCFAVTPIRTAPRPRSVRWAS